MPCSAWRNLNIMGENKSNYQSQNEETEYTLSRTENVVFTLLEELKAICIENKIRFSLFGETAASAVSNSKLRKPYALIMINADDFERFIKNVESNLAPNRALDYIGKATNYKSFGARYHNTQTSYISLGQTRNYYPSGMFVDIVVMRSFIPSAIKRAEMNFLEHGREGTFKHAGTFSSLKYKIPKDAVKAAKLLFGEEKTDKFIFNALLKSYGESFGKSEYYFKRFNRRITTFESNPLSRLRSAELYGEEYPVVKNLNEFLIKTYTPNWKEAVLKPGRDLNGVVVSDCIGFEQMTQQLKENGHELNNFYRLFDKKKKGHATYLKYDKMKKSNWFSAKATNDRLILSKYYEPLMPLIRRLYKNNDYVRLEKVMRRHRNAVVKHLNQGRGFAVNRELFEIQLDIFRFEGKSAVAQKLIEITPSQYMKNPG